MKKFAVLLLVMVFCGLSAVSTAGTIEPNYEVSGKLSYWSCSPELYGVG